MDTLNRNLESQINYLLCKEGLGETIQKTVTTVQIPTIQAAAKPRIHHWFVIALATIVILMASYVLMS